MEYINEFVKNIVIFILFINVGGILINDKDSKKIYRFVSGLIMIIIVLNTLFGLVDVDIDYIFKQELAKGTMDELKLQIEDNNEYIKDNSTSMYKQILKENITRIVEVEGYNLTDMVMVFDEESENISGLSIEISYDVYKEIEKIKEIEEIKEIKVEIGTGDVLNNGEDDTKLNNGNEKYNKSNNIVIGNIRKNIFILYGIPYECINVYIREGTYEGE